MGFPGGEVICRFERCWVPSTWIWSGGVGIGGDGGALIPSGFPFTSEERAPFSFGEDDNKAVFWTEDGSSCLALKHK